MIRPNALKLITIDNRNIRETIAASTESEMAGEYKEFIFYFILNLSFLYLGFT